MKPENPNVSVFNSKATMKSLEAFTLKQLKEVLGSHKQYHNIENIVSACFLVSATLCSLAVSSP